MGPIKLLTPNVQPLTLTHMMEGSCSYRHARVILDYVRARNPQNLPMLWAFLRKRQPESADPEALFTDPRRRIDILLFEDLLAAAKRVTCDDMVAYKAALAKPDKGGADSLLMRYCARVFGLKKVLRKTLESNRIPGGAQAGVVFPSKTHAVIRLHWPGDVRLPADFCWFMKGTLQAVPTRFARGPARLWERTCFFKGGSCCEYELWWDKKAGDRPVVPGAKFAEGARSPGGPGFQKPDDRRETSGGAQPSPPGDRLVGSALRTVRAGETGLPGPKKRPARFREKRGPEPTSPGRQEVGPHHAKASRKSATVLLADHPAMLVDIDRQMLEALGYRVLAAGSGREALEVYERHQDEISLAVVDSQMPDMGGPVIYERLRAINPRVKILFLSAGGDDRALRNMAKGRNGLIAKPFSLECLCVAVGRLVNGNGHHG